MAMRVKWTEAEDNIVKQHWGSLTSPEIALLLKGRNDASVRVRAQKLGLVQKRGATTPFLKAKQARNQSIVRMRSTLSIAEIARRMKIRPDTVKSVLRKADPTYTDLPNQSDVDAPMCDERTVVVPPPSAPVSVVTVRAEAPPEDKGMTFDLPPERSMWLTSRGVERDVLRCFCGKEGAVVCKAHKKRLAEILG
ncbi:MAG: hypothetical protein KDI55_00170 [Anaerolineae bacterium]|nr:hypothetical protein [Anaerolineae bacterium]